MDTNNFKQYCSIENTDNQKKIYSIKKCYSNEGWIAIEKVHGSNFSFIYNGNVLNIAKRTDILNDQSNFFNCNQIKEKYQNDIIEIYKRIKLDIPNIKQIHVYGHTSLDLRL